jgi:hypothetical protein
MGPIPASQSFYQGEGDDLVSLFEFDHSAFDDLGGNTNPHDRPFGGQDPDFLKVGFKFTFGAAGDLETNSSLLLGEASAGDCISNLGLLARDLTDSRHRSIPGPENESYESEMILTKGEKP